jgi:hypothetical protein
LRRLAGEAGRRSAAGEREQSVEALAVEQLIVPRNNTVFARVMPGLLGRAMATDRYHMRAYEARRRALATDASLKADLELIAQEWLALAEEVEWLERNYGPLVSQQADASPPSKTIIQQQRQIQPKDEDKID